MVFKRSDDLWQYSVRINDESLEEQIEQYAKEREWSKGQAIRDVLETVMESDDLDGDVQLVKNEGREDPTTFTTSNDDLKEFIDDFTDEYDTNESKAITYLLREGLQIEQDSQFLFEPGEGGDAP